jgi:hypothetical protein
MTEEERKQNYSRRKMKKDALCPESITMENLAWVLEIESPIIQGQRATTREVAWNDPNFFNPTWKPLFIPPKFEQSSKPVNTDANEMTNVLQHRKVTHGERQALRAQQNQRFQDKCVNWPSSPLHEDEDVMPPKLTEDHPLDDSRKFLTSLFFLKKYKSSTSVVIVVSCIGLQRIKRGPYTKTILRTNDSRKIKMAWLLNYLKNID